ncbi:MAG TPA: NADH-quinone oxidoreductase subunit M [Leadbetterella sp.]|nr:NADH-quinone oxidoreductase subunit M [Leadbetterella sp.]
MQSGLLSSLIILPLIASFVILLLPESYKGSYRWISLITQVLLLINIGTLLGAFEPEHVGYQFLEHFEWIRLSLGNSSILSIDYIVGIDGLSLSMISLAVVVFAIANISSFAINKKEKAYYSLFLLLTATVIGCFIALDFFLFFIFFEFMLLPMYFLIGIWGGPNKAYASLKFIIYTLVGSVMILIVMIALAMSNVDEFFTSEYKRTVFSFDFRILSDQANLLKGSLLNIENPIQIFGVPARDFMFILLFIGFGIKLPMVPFHTWLPDAHVEAPTPISVVLAGILLKIGGYGLIRIGFGFFPDIAINYGLLTSIMGLISILYGAFNALAQKDLKKLIAYSSVSHMGFVMIGIGAFNAEGFNGAIFQMFSHGLLSSMLFLIAGVLYERTKNREIANFQGLAKIMPLYTITVAIAFFGSLGLPSLSGFIGEFFTLFGSFQASSVPKVIPILGVLGIVLSAIYLLWTFQKMFFGEFWTKEDFKSNLVDLNQKEIIMLGVLSILTILFGVFPNLLFDLINPTVIQLF